MKAVHDQFSISLAFAPFESVPQEVVLSDSSGDPARHALSGAALVRCSSFVFRPDLDSSRGCHRTSCLLAPVEALPCVWSIACLSGVHYLLPLLP
jgi:hypothetical protein